MSLQQSEAHRDRVRETMADGAPPPSAGAISRAATKNGARHLRALAAERRRQEIAEAAGMGVEVISKVTIDKSWTEAEDTVVRALYPHYAQMRLKIPYRSYNAFRGRAATLGIIPIRKMWTPKEEAILRRIWASATPAELVAALPRWSAHAIKNKARNLDLKQRGRPPLVLTGNVLCDAIRDRARVLGYSSVYIDRIARSGMYFQHSQWKGKSGHLAAPMIRAVNALGGTLNVEWPD